ncbi:exosome complex component rrp40 [Anaeramoeba flamelloides]|uniref:Ribosomal RNA-processing protein 40 n=1 Tax=Anaeramoeba flamelloides TaxID=1746091 RepID=A0AAV7YRJ5_9EUKA|nr:exosome complex component rrp40 [Anaeramoeba flamelloides]
MDSELLGTFVLPGEKLGEMNSNPIKIGNGLVIRNGSIVSSKCGILQFKKPDKYWINNNQKRYNPIVGQHVIGFITQKAGTNYLVDLGTNVPAVLSFFGFPGATKKNRPQLKINDTVYARIVVSNGTEEPQIVCMDKNERASGFGQLEGGYCFKCSLNLSRKFLQPRNKILSYLGKKLKFEIAVGVNGRIWINSGSVQDTILITNAIQKTEGLTEKPARKVINMLFDNMM